MRGYVSTGPGCHHASWQARRRDGWSRRKRLGGGGDSDLCRLLEAYRGEKKGADDVDEGTTNPTEETQEIRSVISHVFGIPKTWKCPNGNTSAKTPVTVISTFREFQRTW